MIRAGAKGECADRLGGLVRVGGEEVIEPFVAEGGEEVFSVEWNEKER